MRIPRRAPRTVYVVQDANDLLGDPAGGEPAGGEQEAGLGWEHEADLQASQAEVGAHEVGAQVRRERVEGLTDPAAQRPSRGVPVWRALAGALLCLIAIFAVCSIVLGLLSLAGSDTHVARQRLDGNPRISRQSTAEQGERSGEAPSRARRSQVHLVRRRESRPTDRKPLAVHREPLSMHGAVALPPMGRSPALDATPTTSASTVIASAVVTGEAVDEFGFER